MLLLCGTIKEQKCKHEAGLRSEDRRNPTETIKLGKRFQICMFQRDHVL